MKILDRIGLIIFSNLILIISIVLCLLIFGWLPVDTLYDITKVALNDPVTTNVALLVSMLSIVLAVRCIFFSTDKNEINGIKDGILLQNSDGQLVISKSTLEELGYFVFHKIMSPAEYANVPQNRERIFIVCFDKERVPNYENFVFPEKVKLTRTIHDCLDHTVSDKRFIYTEKMSHYDELKENITSRDTVYQWRRQYVRENKSGLCPTLTANMGTGGHNVPLILSDYGIRKLTPRECLNFQGFPAEYKFPETNAISANYKQAGNSVTVPLIEKFFKKYGRL